MALQHEGLDALDVADGSSTSFSSASIRFLVHAVVGEDVAQAGGAFLHLLQLRS